jgi:hypothetical protein
MDKKIFHFFTCKPKPLRLAWLQTKMQYFFFHSNSTSPPHTVGDIINGGREIVTAVTWRERQWNGWTEAWDPAHWVVETKPNPDWSPLPPETTAAIAASLDWEAVGHLVAGIFPLRLQLNLSEEDRAALLPHLIEATKRAQPDLWRRKFIQRQFDLRCAHLRAERQAAFERELAAIEPQIAAIKADPANWREVTVDERLRDEDGAPYGGWYQTTARVLTKEAGAKIEALREAALAASGWRSDAEISEQVKATMTPEERACL